MKHNEKDPLYGEVRSKMEGRNMTVKSMAAEMNWAYFAPISIDECCEIPSRLGMRSDSSGDDNDE